MKISIRALLIATGIVSFLLWVIVVLGGAIREQRNRVNCSNQMRHLALAIMNYESAHQKLPMAVEIGPDGKPWHSWRVAISPFLESNSFANSYDQREPWNGPNNSSHTYEYNYYATNYCSCPSDQDKRGNLKISTVVVCGNETMFPPDRQVALSEVTDGLENTIILAESVNSDVLFAEPGDLNFSTMSFQVNDLSKPSISSWHFLQRGPFGKRVRGANVVFADGDCYFMTEEIAVKELKALLTIAGGENITRQQLIDRGVLR